jgi:hypothetical protein
VGFDGLIAGAAFGVEKGQEVLEGFGIGGVPEEGSFAADLDEVFVFELFEVMGEGAGRDGQFGADVADDEALGVGAEEEADDAEAGFGAEGGEHVGVAGDEFGVVGVGLGGLSLHGNSTITEI